MEFLFHTWGLLILHTPGAKSLRNEPVLSGLVTDLRDEIFMGASRDPIIHTDLDIGGQNLRTTRLISENQVVTMTHIKYDVALIN